MVFAWTAATTFHFWLDLHIHAKHSGSAESNHPTLNEVRTELCEDVRMFTKELESQVSRLARAWSKVKRCTKANLCGCVRQRIDLPRYKGVSKRVVREGSHHDMNTNYGSIFCSYPCSTNIHRQTHSESSQYPRQQFLNHEIQLPG